MSKISWNLLGPPETETESPGFSWERGPFSCRWRRATSGLSAGVDQIELCQGRTRVTVLPTRGMGLWRASCDDLHLGWSSPVRGPVHPHFVPLHEPSGLGWLDGFDEWLCRCGLTSNGAPDFDDLGRLHYPLHGRIANRPAHQLQLQLDEEAGTLELTGIVEETRFHFEKLRLTSTVRLRADSTSLELCDQVENCSSGPAGFQMLYHINYGPPLLGAGSQLVAPVSRVVPCETRAAAALPHWTEFQGPQAERPETVYFTSLHGDADGRTQVMLVGPQGNQGATLDFSLQQLPYFTLWKNETALADGYVTGLEPGTNFPNPRSFEGAQGRVVELAPHAKYLMGLTLGFAMNRTEVEQRREAIAALQGGRAPRVEPQPQADWCAGVGG